MERGKLVISLPCAGALYRGSPARLALLSS
jgi:hypothetical protein